MRVKGLSSKNPSPIAPIAKKLNDKIRNRPFHLIVVSVLFMEWIENSLPVTVLTNKEIARKIKANPLYSISIALSFNPINSTTGAPGAKKRKKNTYI